MFYAFGDDHLRCSEILHDERILCLVNSRLLLDHMSESGLVKNAVAFEPAFPRQVYKSKEMGQGTGKRNFFFYARPRNERNLYWRGLEVLCAAIEENVLDPGLWEFHFAGHGGTQVILPRGATAQFPGPMPWAQYAAFIGRMDVGLSLMYTPHPSYPPLDLAASGAVVVTSRFGRKQNLDAYSTNIICAETDVASLLAGLRKAVEMAADPAACAARTAQNGLERNWAVSMAPALERLVSWVDSASTSQ